jgi:hypothetical protein
MTCDSCGQPSTRTLYGMCVHEHYREHPKCDRHAAAILAISAKGRLYCDPCWHAPAPHECHLTANSKAAAA